MEHDDNKTYGDTFTRRSAERGARGQLRNMAVRIVMGTVTDQNGIVWRADFKQLLALKIPYRIVGPGQIFVEPTLVDRLPSRNRQ